MGTGREWMVQLLGPGEGANEAYLELTRRYIKSEAPTHGREENNPCLKRTWNVVKADHLRFCNLMVAMRWVGRWRGVEFHWNVGSRRLRAQSGVESSRDRHLEAEDHLWNKESCCANLCIEPPNCKHKLENKSAGSLWLHWGKSACLTGIWGKVVYPLGDKHSNLCLPLCFLSLVFWYFMFVVSYLHRHQANPLPSSFSNSATR